MPNQQRTVSDLLAEHTDTQRIRLGGVEFHMNSAKYEQTSERAVVTVQTAGGYSRYDYGPKPRAYVLTGCTGLAGVYGLGGVQDLRQFEPQPGQPDRLWSLEFASECRGRRDVKVTSFKFTRSQSSQFYHDLEIRLQAFPKEPLASAVGDNRRSYVAICTAGP